MNTLYKRAIDLAVQGYYHSYMNGDLVPRFDGMIHFIDLFEVDADVFCTDVRNALKEKHGIKNIPFL